MRLVSHPVRVALLILMTVALTVQPRVALAQEYPDFYGTVVAVDRELGFIVIQLDKGDDILINVDYLGDAPWNEGAFQIDKIVIVRTQRVGAEYLAISWEEARNGRERFRG